MPFKLCFEFIYKQKIVNQGPLNDESYPNRSDWIQAISAWLRGSRD